MDKQLDFDYIRFEWDISKNTSNQTKHGLSFELAIYAFFENRVLVKDIKLSMVNSVGVLWV